MANARPPAAPAYVFGWAYRWKNAGGDPMVTVPEAHFDALTAVADDSLALLDQHITDEQERELRLRIIERMKFLERPT